MMQIDRIKPMDVKVASDNVSTGSRYQKLIKFGLSEIERFEQEKIKQQCVSALNVKIESTAPSGSISLEVLGLVSGGLQRIFSSLCNNIIGNKKSKGPIPKEILEYSNLMLVSSSPGSFNMHIDQYPQNNQLLIHEAQNVDLLPELESIFQLVSSSNDEIETVVEQYGPRTFTIMNTWFQQLQQKDIEFSILRPEKKSIVFNKEHIQSTCKRLADVKVKESSEVKVVNGVVYGANPSTNTLTFMLDNGEKITAHAPSNVLHQNLVLITTKYTIRFNVTKIHHISTNKTKKSYHVIDMEVNQKAT